MALIHERMYATSDLANIGFLEYLRYLADRLQYADDEVNQTRFTIQDTGVGMPTEFHDAIFELFTQVNGSHSRRFEGTGLGLSFCKRVIERTNGNIGLTAA